MEYIEVEYNRELKPLEAILSDVKRPGDFFIAGTMEIPMPRVEVKGVGTLSFPIPGPQIEALVQHATQAPYGRGEETIVDTSCAQRLADRSIGRAFLGEIGVKWIGAV